MKKLFTYKVLWLLLLLPMFSGCNDSDDVAAIFTGKTWRLSYINLKDKGGMMGGFDEESIKLFDDKKKSTYLITFVGVEENNKITGSVGGKVITAEIKGTWSANGKDNQFKANISNMNETDALAKEFIEGLNNATSYEGDNNNLFLYYKSPKNQQTYVLAFHVKQ